MTGYLYQCELALLELAERSWHDPAAEVRMEVLDDIEFLHGTGTPEELCSPNTARKQVNSARLARTSGARWPRGSTP